MIEKLNKIFESRVRMGIMAILAVNETISFHELKERLDATDGNLSSHGAALEKQNYIEIQKTFIGKKPHTLFKATKIGKKAFLDHINALEYIIKNIQ